MQPGEAGHEPACTRQLATAAVRRGAAAHRSRVWKSTPPAIPPVHAGSMQKPEFIDEAHTPAGELIKLTRESGHFVVRVDGALLMSSGAYHSEERMAEIGCEGLRDKPGARVLVGGLGLGYTLRAALDQVGPRGTVVVSELLESVVEWNRGPVGHLAGNPLGDPRTRVEVGDLVAYIRSRPEPFDALLLDVDHGPDSFTTDANSSLYSGRGLGRLRAALRPGGVLVVWSGYECPPFVAAMKRAGFTARSVRARARGDRGPRHTLFVGKRVEGAQRIYRGQQDGGGQRSGGAQRGRGGQPGRRSRRR